MDGALAGDSAELRVAHWAVVKAFLWVAPLAENWDDDWAGTMDGKRAVASALMRDGQQAVWKADPRAALWDATDDSSADERAAQRVCA